MESYLAQSSQLHHATFHSIEHKLCFLKNSGTRKRDLMHWKAFPSCLGIWKTIWETWKSHPFSIIIAWIPLSIFQYTPHLKCEDSAASTPLLNTTKGFSAFQPPPTSLLLTHKVLSRALLTAKPHKTSFCIKCFLFKISYRPKSRLMDLSGGFMNLQVEPKNAIRNCIPGHYFMSGKALRKS